jgi:hypothetical protein
LPANVGKQILDAVGAGHEWGFFRQHIDSPGLLFRLLEFGNGIRARYLRRVFGDQAMWVTRSAFESVDGFPDEPLMEDVTISRRLGKRSRPFPISHRVVVNPRRWKKNGIIRQTLRNWLIQFRFLLGAKPADLACSYSRHDSQSDRD